MANKRNSEPRGVRGPRGPRRPASSGRSMGARQPATPARRQFEEFSRPLLTRMHALPRWIMVVLPAVILLSGLVLTESWAWLGGVLLLIVSAFLGWLLALSWPVLNPGSRIIRGLTVLAIVGLAYFKFTGRF